MSEKNQKNRVVFICFVGLMAALCMVSNYLQIRIPIGGDAGTRIHFGNIFCLLSGFLLGGAGGGLAAGIGAAVFDLTDPTFAPEFYITFIFKFLMAFVCGIIAYAGKKQGKNFGRNVVAGIAGQLTYIVLYLSKTFVVKYWIEKNDIATVWTMMIPKAATSLTNGAIAVIVAIPLTFALRKALEAAHLDQYLSLRGE